eukprot:CAMPEP_0182611906 /NCGR_PEP_ID=MMETSP1330-20130603/15925_1 /TAXON_ID=464278 /ORGANISM="Picochlorum sp., Strain RCC944" /LENGTH=79 /DNA_ID=CAMNT_0024831367 /DNA_START=20 /DNA_END=257 /DNA_ORIENTATION=+
MTIHVHMMHVLPDIGHVTNEDVVVPGPAVPPVPAVAVPRPLPRAPFFPVPRGSYSSPDEHASSSEAPDDREQGPRPLSD